jgi:hypothetical protein
LSAVVVRVTVLAPEAIVDVELRPQPAVPPTAIVPASSVVIVRDGVVSLVGVDTAAVSAGVLAVVSIVNAVNASALAAFPAVSVKVIEHEYAASPLVVRVTVLAPEAIVAVELRPQFVPETAIVPTSAVVITTSGVVSLVGVVTTVVSEGVATAVSSVNAVNVRAAAAFVAVSVKVIVHV